MHPANDTIQDFTKKLPLNHEEYKKEVLIKASFGNNHFGLDPTQQIQVMFKQKITENDKVMIYDKFRNIFGFCKDSVLEDVINNFGKYSELFN